MDKRIITELLLIGHRCDVKNQGKIILSLMECFDILDSMVDIESQRKGTHPLIVEAEANLIWMRAWKILSDEGIKIGNIGSYERHLDRTYSPSIYLTYVN
jgi:hypothetical protein